MQTYRRTRYIGGPKLDTPTTAERAAALKTRLAELKPDPRHDDIHNPYDFDDSERY